MFTLFDLIRLLAMVGGAAALSAIGWKTFGIIGCVVGVPLGFVMGGMIGQVPLIVALKWMSRRFDSMTDEELVAELHNPECLTPNVLLLELNRRGSDIQRELPFVQSLLTSDEMHRRTSGWAALTSAYPELVGRIPGYNPTATAAECQTKCQPLLNATEPSDAPKPPSGAF
jgi:hypothetical protein